METIQISHHPRSFSVKFLYNTAHSYRTFHSRGLTAFPCPLSSRLPAHPPYSKGQEPLYFMSSFSSLFSNAQSPQLGTFSAAGLCLLIVPSSVSFPPKTTYVGAMGALCSPLSVSTAYRQRCFFASLLWNSGVPRVFDLLAVYLDILG